LQKFLVIKIGGELVDSTEHLDTVLQRIGSVGESKILVHGGGRLLSDLAKRLGIPVIMTGGRRVTDQETLKLAAMVYAGLINKTIVARLQALGCPAVGLSGADGRTVLAERRKAGAIDYGFAGDIREVNAGLLSLLISNRYMPVLCSLTADLNGQLLNTNADTIAAETAIAMHQDYDVELHLLTDRPGLLFDVDDDQSVIDEINPDSYEQLKAEGRVSDGMLPKLDNAFRALELGVGTVYISHFSKFPDYKTGTRINRDK
jgi:acetylglutamate kinase